MTLDTLLTRLRNDHRQRLRWRILRLFGLCPGSRAARRVSDADCLLCGLNLLLDMGAGGGGEAPGRNPAFDTERFSELRGGAE